MVPFGLIFYSLLFVVDHLSQVTYSEITYCLLKKAISYLLQNHSLQVKRVCINMHPFAVSFSCKHYFSYLHDYSFHNRGISDKDFCLDLKGESS